MINREVTNIWPGIEPTHTETADCTTRCYLVRGSLTQKEPLKLEGQTYQQSEANGREKATGWIIQVSYDVACLRPGIHDIFRICTHNRHWSIKE